MSGEHHTAEAEANDDDDGVMWELDEAERAELEHIWEERAELDDDDVWAERKNHGGGGGGVGIGNNDDIDDGKYAHVSAHGLHSMLQGRMERIEERLAELMSEMAPTSGMSVMKGRRRMVDSDQHKVARMQGCVEELMELVECKKSLRAAFMKNRSLRDQLERTVEYAMELLKRLENLDLIVTLLHAVENGKIITWSAQMIIAQMVCFIAEGSVGSGLYCLTMLKFENVKHNIGAYNAALHALLIYHVRKTRGSIALEDEEILAGVKAMGVEDASLDALLVDVMQKMDLADIRPNQTTFVLLMRGLVEAGAMHEAEQHFTRMVDHYGLNLDTIVLGIMVNGCLKFDMVERARHYFDMMMTTSHHDTVIPVDTVDHVVHALAKRSSLRMPSLIDRQRQGQLVMDVVKKQKYLKHQTVPQQTNWQQQQTSQEQEPEDSTLADDTFLFDLTEDATMDAQQRSTQALPITLSQLVAGLFTRKSHPDGNDHGDHYTVLLEMFRSMEISGCQPELSTLTSLIDGLIVSDQVLSALQVVHRVSESDICLSLHCLMPIIRYFATQQSRMDHAAALFYCVHVGRHGALINETIRLFADKNEPDMAHRVYGELKSMNQQLELSTAHSLLKCLIRTGRMELAETFFHEDMPKFWDMKHTTMTFNLMFAGYVKLKKLDAAMELFRQMEKGTGVCPDVLTLNTLVRGMIDAGQPKECLAFVKRMARMYSVLPNETTKKLIKNFM